MIGQIDCILHLNMIKSDYLKSELKVKELFYERMDRHYKKSYNAYTI